MKYYEYLRSPAWKKKRAEALRHYGYACAVCGSKRRLHTHHLHYNTLGHERMEDLRILCKKHHPKGHYSAFAIRRDAQASVYVDLLILLSRSIERALAFLIQKLYKGLSTLLRKAVTRLKQ